MSYREEKIARARELFLSGYNCAQSVAGAFAPEMGMELKQVVRLAGGLGGGLGGIRVLCGAVSAMCLVLGQLCGYDEPDDMEGKRPSMHRNSAWLRSSPTAMTPSTAARSWSAPGLR